MRKPSVLVIFLTVFIDLIGFGIIVPFIPSYGEHFGAHGIVIGAIFACYSAMQFIFSPIWGRLSDRYGRRPIPTPRRPSLDGRQSANRLSLCHLRISRTLRGFCLPFLHEKAVRSRHLPHGLH